MFTKPRRKSVPFHSEFFKKAKTCFLFTFFLLFLVPSMLLAVDSEKPVTLDKKSLFKTELELAKKGKVYSVLNLSSHQLIVKIKGVPVKEFHLDSVSSAKGGDYVGSAHRLIKKYPVMPTIEKEIPPSETSEIRTSPLLSTETVFVSVGDMPSRYRLYFEDGLMISVIPAFQECICGEIEKRLRLIKAAAVTFSWETGRLIADRRFPDLSLTLAEEEAQALFWSFSEETWLLIQ